MAELCGLLGVSKQAYYQYDEDAVHAKAAREEFAIQYIRDVRKDDPGIGGKKLWYMYQRDFRFDCPIGRDRFCRIIDEQGLKVRWKRRKPRTTDSTHGLPTYPNLIKDYVPASADRLWVSDITYIVITEDDYHCHFCYLSLILDAYTEEIIGWSVLKISLQNFHSGSPDDSYFLKSGGSTFLKTVGSLFSEICGNKITAYSQHDRVRGSEGQRPGGTHQQHDEERAAQGQGVQEHQRGSGGGRPGRGLLQQPETAYEHRNEDPVRSSGADRR